MRLAKAIALARFRARRRADADAYAHAYASTRRASTAAFSPASAFDQSGTPHPTLTEHAPACTQCSTLNRSRASTLAPLRLRLRSHRRSLSYTASLRAHALTQAELRERRSELEDAAFGGDHPDFPRGRDVDADTDYSPLPLPLPPQLGPERYGEGSEHARRAAREAQTRARGWRAIGPSGDDEVELSRLMRRYAPFSEPGPASGSVLEKGKGNGNGKGKGRAVDEYEPDDADFAPRGEAYAYEDPYAGGLDESESPRELGIAPVIGDLTLEDGNRIRRRRRRRGEVHSLPPLAVGEAEAAVVLDEEARYDWRTVAPSRTRRARGGKWWYPALQINRVKATGRELQPGERYHGEVTTYVAHFTKLLEAELAEMRRLHAERMTEWPEHRLAQDGVMLDNLGARPVGPNVKKPESGVLYEFSKVGNQATRPFGSHRFRYGESIEICRSHPLGDYVTAEGEVNALVDDGGVDEHGVRVLPEYNPDQRLFGSVQYETASFLRLHFPVEIGEIEKGKWRIDLSVNDWTIKRQIAALKSLHSDPVAIERDDAAQAASTAASAASRPSLLSSGSRGADEDEAFTMHSPYQRRSETILHGTSLRDKLLRAFQEDYVPYEADPMALDSGQNVMLEGGQGGTHVGVAPVAVDGIRPEDVDATSVPPPHPAYEPLSALMRHPGLRSWTERYRVEGAPARERGDPELELNPSQMRAIAMMLSERLSLVQGPPGTGKTRTIIEAIKLLKLHWKLPHPVLVTAHTNAAVDNLLGGLHAHGLKAIRMGAGERVRDDLAHLALDRQVEAHPAGRELVGLKEEREAVVLQIAEMRRGERQAGVGGGGGGQAVANLGAMGRLVSRRMQLNGLIAKLERKVMRDLLLDADVVCTTCLSSVSKNLDQIDFPVVFLDEASMATEPLSLVALTKGSSHVAIIGDHKQLPPVIIAPDAHAGGLSTSLFERLIHEKDVPSIMLDTQYRMHPNISSFPNRAFYGAALKDGTVLGNGRVKSGLEPPVTAFLASDAQGKRHSVSFIDVDSAETPSNMSLQNEGEAAVVCDALMDLLASNPDLKGSDIGIITPYASQIRLLDKFVNQDEERLAAFRDELGEERARELEHVEIKTVDGFEGREKAVILFSTVRSNQLGYVGFLADWRRLNVGLTRARRGLIMVGNAETLGKARNGAVAHETLPKGGSEVWRRYMRYLRDEGLVLRA